MDHINTNSFLDCDIMRGILKYDISQHFEVLMFLISKESGISLHKKDNYIMQLDISSKNIGEFKYLFSQVNWESATFFFYFNFTRLKYASSAYNRFSYIFYGLYDLIPSRARGKDET